MRYHVTSGASSHDSPDPDAARASRARTAVDPAADGDGPAVDVTAAPNGDLVVLLDGRPVSVDAVDLGDGSLSVRVGGVVVDITPGAGRGASDDAEVVAIARGHRPALRVQSERARSAAAARRGAGGAASDADRVVRSPMPGRVVKVLVQPGDEVQPNQGVAVVEAMKMENEVRARTGGRVAEVHVKPGAAVEGRAKLVTLA